MKSIDLLYRMKRALEYICPPFNELSLQQLYDIMVFRQEVFVVEQDCPYLDADGKDQMAHHLMGYLDGQLVAYTRLLPKGGSYENYISIGRVITAQSVRRDGYGKGLVKRSIQEIRTLYGAFDIKISAQCYLLKFYKELGFQPVGKEYLEDNIPHIAMIHSVDS